MPEYKFVGPYEQAYLFPGQTINAVPGGVYSLRQEPPTDGHWEPVPDSTPVANNPKKEAK